MNDDPLAQTPATYAARLESIETRLAEGSDRMDRTEATLIENTSMTRDVHELLPAMRQMHEMFLTWQSGMNAIAKFGRGLGWVGGKLYTAIKVLTPIAAGVTALIAAWHAAFPHKGP